MPTCEKRIPKPLMHGYHQRIALRNVIVAVLLAGTTGLLFKLYIVNPQKALYENFHANTDPYKMFEDIRATGAFRSCAPDPPPKKKK